MSDATTGAQIATVLTAIGAFVAAVVTAFRSARSDYIDTARGLLKMVREELAQATTDRDDARAEADHLRDQIRQLQRSLDAANRRLRFHDQAPDQP